VSKIKVLRDRSRRDIGPSKLRGGRKDSI